MPFAIRVKNKNKISFASRLEPGKLIDQPADGTVNDYFTKHIVINAEAKAWEIYDSVVANNDIVGDVQLIRIK